MKITVSIFCLFLSFFAKSHEHQIPSIEVIGNAVTQVSPDLIHWSVKINNHGYKLDDVAKSHQVILGQTLKLIKQQAIKQDTLQTTNMDFGEKTKYQQNNRINDGYFASTHISFTLSDIEQYQSIWMMLAKIEGLSIESVNYDSTQRIQIQNKTRINALQAARTKAIEMASALEVTIGDPISITEPSSGGIMNRQLNRLAMSESNPGSLPSISTGKIDIQIQVHVTFELLKNINMNKG